MTIGSTVRDTGRARARTLLRHGGSRFAKLDQRAPTHRLIVRALPLALAKRFDPDSARGLEAVLELRVSNPDGREPDLFELMISDGSCEVRPGPAHDPGASAQIGADDMIRLASGAVGWPQLLAAGRLELSGDPFLALRFPNLFRLPAQSPPSTSLSP